MSEGREFGETLARLRQQREEAEKELLARLEDLTGRVEAVKEAASEAEDAARAEAGAGEPPRSGAATPDPEDDADRVDQQPWPSGSGIRGVLNRLLRWALRDYLASLDQRHRATEQALRRQASRQRERLGEALEELREDLEAERQRRRERIAAGVERMETIRELANRQAESLDRVADVILQLREWVNATQAESVHVATEGVRERADLVLQELARQQEALLAELVGRRRELDALLTEVRRGSPD